MTNIKDIAKISGFSINTVANALLDKKNVKKTTKETIKRIAENLNYIPNAIARSLVSKKSHLIALLIHSIGDPFYTELINHIEKFVYSSNYRLMLFNHNESIERQKKILQSILEQGIDGVLISPALNDKTIIEKIINYNIPFVILTRNYEDFHVNFVGIDFKTGLKIVVDHFFKYNRKRILNICGSDVTPTSKMRLLGYKNALNTHNIEFDKELLIETIKNKEHLYYQLDNLIKSKKEVDAIYCYDYFTTTTVLEYCKTNNINIPKDIAVIGYEFESFCNNSYIPLTTLKMDIFTISKNAWLILKQLIDSKNSSKLVKNIYTAPELIIRESCGEKIK